MRYTTRKIASNHFPQIKLPKQWLYATDSEVIIINCENDLEASTHTLEGVGILTINETCKGYCIPLYMRLEIY